jgi:hypothetical protein
MEQSAWEATSHSATQEFSIFQHFIEPDGSCHIYKSPQKSFKAGKHNRSVNRAVANISIPWLEIKSRFSIIILEQLASWTIGMLYAITIAQSIAIRLIMILNTFYVWSHIHVDTNDISLQIRPI